MSKNQKPSRSSGKIDFTKRYPYEGFCGLVYARVSSKRQEVEGSGLSSQEERCKNDLSSINVPCDRTFLDSYTGGGDFMNRPAMRELLSYIDARPHKKYLVIFDDLKRFARDVEFHLKLKAAFELRGVVLKCLNYTFSDTPEGRYSEIIMAGHAELERHQNQRQVIQKQKARLEAGYYPFNSKRGYELTRVAGHHGKFAVPNEIGMQLLKPALEGFANGTLVRKVDVARFLFNKGLWKTQTAEKYIDKVSEILRDSFYAGYIEYPKWEVSRRVGQHQGIISPETFELIQKRIRKVDLNQRIRLDISPDFPLRGLIIHDKCKGHLTSAWYSNGKGKKYRKHVCHTLGCSDYNKPFAARDVERRFEDVLKKGALKKEVGVLLKKMFDRVWADELNNIKQQDRISEQQKRALDKKLTDLTDLMLGARSPAVRRSYERQIEVAAMEQEAIEAKSTAGLDMTTPYQTALEKATVLLKRPHVAWKRLNVHEQHGLFFFLFQEKLPYSITEGYQTTEIPYATRLFEDFVTETTHLVEMMGVKPMSKTFSPSNCSQD